MNGEQKEWSNGIPTYSHDDILSGMELHAFCTNTVAQQMQDEGYVIEGVVLHNSPTQVIATRDGQRYAIMVAGDVYPYAGKVSHQIKKRFASFCKKQGTVPLFASVGICSHDPVRGRAGLALKNDGFLIKYEGNEDLSSLQDPACEEDGYQAFCVEKIAEAYCTGRFEQLYNLFDDHIEFHSQWVLTPTTGKQKLIEYFEAKGEAIKNSGGQLHGTVVITTGGKKQNGNFISVSQPGKICALIGQNNGNGITWVFVTPTFSEENKLTRISLNSPDLFEFRPYYAFE